LLTLSKFGNVDEQLAAVAEQLAAVPELRGGFDGLGFSQGGFGVVSFSFILLKYLDQADSSFVLT
jgi:hypothetical protein